MTYTALQDLLTIAAIAPWLIAAALLISHLVNCWRRAKTSQTAFWLTLQFDCRTLQLRISSG